MLKLRKRRTSQVFFGVLLAAASTHLWGVQQTLSGNGITLTYNDATDCAGAPAAECNASMQKAFNSNTTQFQLNGLQDYLKYMSSAQAMASKGHGVEYTTNHSIFVVGASIGAAVDIGNQTLAQAEESLKKSGSIPSVGGAYQFSVMGGVNLGALKALPKLGPVDLKRLSLYGHGGGYNFTNLIKQDGVTAKSLQIGFHAKYKVIAPVSLGFGTLNWGGLDLISGFTYATNTLGYAKTFDEQSTGDGTLASPLIKTRPAGSITVENRAATIPIEIATSVRLIYILSIFGGMGVDFNFGKTTVDMAVESTSITATVGPSTQNAPNAKLRINASDNNSGRFGDLRFFGGLAVNLIPLKQTNVLSLFAQGNYSVGGGYGVLLGVRAGF